MLSLDHPDLSGKITSRRFYGLNLACHRKLLTISSIKARLVTLYPLKSGKMEGLEYHFQVGGEKRKQNCQR